MAINIQNIVAALEAKVAAATNATETQELIVIIKTIKAAGQQTVTTYASVAALPVASQDNAGNLAYVAAVGKIYYSNGTVWTEVGSGSSSGGGGTAYDQDLNTTDDVVFNSTLIGDVSIVGNTISGVDAYGNSDTLVVDGSLNVQFGGQSTTTQTVYAYNYGYSGSAFVIEYPGTRFKITGASVLGDVSAFVSGANIVMSDPQGSGTYTLVLTSDMTWDGSQWIANCQLTSGVNVSYVGDITLYGYQGPITVTSGAIDTLVNVLEVTASGVNVEGEFTVNGQAIAGGSGSSYDQDLNTTDDVVFNSALVGDVSIVGNQISATDSYGNSDTLVVDGGLDIKSIATSITDYQYSSPASSGQWDGNWYWQGTTLSTANPSGNTLTLIQSLKVGDKVTFQDQMNVGNYVTVTLISAMSFNGMSYIATVAENNLYMGIGAYNNILTITSLVTKTSSFDNTGLSVDGNLVVVGNLTLADTTEVPTSTTTPVKYAKVVVAGQTYFMPLFQ